MEITVANFEISKSSFTTSPSSRLDRGTIWNGPRKTPHDEAYRVVVRDYGEGLVEATATVNFPARRRRKGGFQPRAMTPERQADNRDRALRRARATIRQTIMTAHLDHLLTLTYRENQLCPKTAWRHFKRFLRLLREECNGAVFSFVAVLERQKRGAAHIHAAVSGHQDVRQLRALWHRAIGSNDGNIDVQFFRGRLPTLARYLSKYIAKTFVDEHLSGVHRYKRSRGIHVPMAVFLLPYTVSLDSEVLRLFDDLGCEVRFHLHTFGTDGPRWLWACSWICNRRRRHHI